MGANRFLDSEKMFDCFRVADLLYDFFKRNGIMNEGYRHYFGNIIFGIKNFTEKNYDRIADVLFQSLLKKPEIKILDDCFYAGGSQYRINPDIFSRIKERQKAYEASLAVYR